MRNSKYRLKESLSAEEVLAVLGVSTEDDFKRVIEMIEQTRLYRHWKKTGKLERLTQDNLEDYSSRDHDYENI